MPRYVLFVARDGDVLHDEVVCPDEESAHTWAARRIAEEFRLDDDARWDFDEAVAECDGYILELASKRTIAEIADCWAGAQVSILTIIGSALDEELREQRKACRNALLELADAAHALSRSWIG